MLSSRAATDAPEEVATVKSFIRAKPSGPPAQDAAWEEEDDEDEDFLDDDEDLGLGDEEDDDFFDDDEDEDLDEAEGELPEEE